ncbi:hypothetical protein [Qipengyuania sp. RANM35]|uniref:hypothetical protein n=1 Tax=Qipengyuania sp. RANM35 TaxID=3068635 RepID=UPI0034DAC921
MKDSVSRGWRTFFWFAAAYNLVIGSGGFLAAHWASPEAINGVLIFCFGIVYALVAGNPTRFAPALLAGILGKAMVVAMLGPPNWFGNGDAAVGAIVAGDLLFTLGFVLFLSRRRENA